MTLYWLLWVSAGCVACGLAGFSTVRYGRHKLLTGEREEAGRSAAPRPRAPAVIASAAAVHERVPQRVAPQPGARPAVTRPKHVAAATTVPAPAPTAARPEAEQLALWARQVKAGERKLSIATDGCRVTWNRTCKHGHPSWLVHLGYLKRRPGLKRQNPR